MAGNRLDAAEGAQLRRREEVEAAAGQALLAALNARENYTAAHSEAVLELALEVAAELGVGAEDATSVGQVALLHDIGKVGVPDAILQKPGRLTGPEWDVMREHPSIGAQIVSAIGSLSHLAPAVRAEHEHWDGGGYPDGLAGEAVPLPSRICFVCDAWHAMTSDRPYRRALTAAQARAEIERHAGTQFCPTTVAALLRVLDREGTPAERSDETRAGRVAAAARAPGPAARGRAAGADHRLGRRRRRAPVRRGARRGRRAGAQGPARLGDLDQPLGAGARSHAHADELRRAQPRRRGATAGGDLGADGARPRAGRARRAVRDRARPRRAARRGARVPRAHRARLGARVADPLRRRRLGRAGGLLAARRAAVHRLARALRRGAVRPGGDGDRPRRAVLAAGVARLPGPAHAAAEPPRARRAARGGGGARARRPGASSRCCSATSTGSRTSTTAPATTPATARCRPPGERWRTRRRRSRAASPAGSAATSSAC